MSNIYVGQSALRIQLTVGQDITGALDLKIKYKKPDKTTGDWTATEKTAATGVIYYDLVDTTELDPKGTWTFWAYVKFSDGREADGDAFKHKISEVGKVI